MKAAGQLESGNLYAERIDAAYDHALTLLAYARDDETDSDLLQAVLAREGAVKALVGILADTLRTQITGPPSPDDLVAKRWRLSAAVAGVAGKVLVNNSSTHADQLATLLLRTEALHACAQQMAAAAELLKPYASIAPSGPSAAASSGSAPSTAGPSNGSQAAPSAALLTLACDTLGSALGMLPGIADRARQGSPTASALASALASSSVMEHAGRLVLLMVQAVAGAPAGDAKRLEPVRVAASAFHKAYTDLESVRVHLRMAARGQEGSGDGGTKLLQDPTGDSRAQLRCVLTGCCARHAAVSLGLAVIASADGGPTYGLPPAAACAVFRDGPHERGAAIEALLDAVDVELTGGNAASGCPPGLGGPLGVHASMRLLLRAGRVVMRWAENKGQSEQRPASLCWWTLHGLSRHCHRLRRLSRSAGWTSEVVADTWRLVGEAVEHVLPYMTEGDQENLGDELSTLLAASSSATGKTCPAALPTRVALPLPPVPLFTAAAVRGGALPLLERLLRRACVDPAGPESRTLQGLQAATEEKRRYGDPADHIVHLLAYGDVRQAAALVTTLGKVLRVKGCRRLGEGKLVVDDTLGGGIPALEFAVLGTAGLLASFPASQLAELLRSLAAADTVCAGEGPASEASVSSGGGGGGAGASSSSAGGGEGSGGGCGDSGAQDTPCGSGPTAQLGWMVAMGLPAWLPPLSQMLQAYLLRTAGQANKVWSAAPADKLVPVLLGYAAGVGALLELGYPAATADGREPGAGSAADTSEAAAWARAVLAEAAVGAVLRRAREVLSLPAGVKLGGLEGGELRGAVMEGVLSVAQAWLVAGCGVEPEIAKLLSGAPMLQGSRQEIDDACRSLAARVAAEAEARLAARGAGGGGEPAEASLAAAGASVTALPAFPGLPTAVVLPACANPACANLAGDSEAGLKLQRCARCGLASYCCRECQTAHWRSGHKAACAPKSG